MHGVKTQKRSVHKFKKN